MPLLEIGGKRVRVGEEFLQLSPEQQQATVDEILQSMPAAAPTAPAGPQVGEAVGTGPDGNPRIFAGTIGGPQAPAPAVEPEQPRQRTAGESLQIGAQNVGSGLAGLAGMPVDLAAGAMNLPLMASDYLFGTETPRFQGGTQTLKDLGTAAAERVGVDVIPPEEQTTGEQILGTAIDFATQAALPSAALANRAMQTVPTPGTPGGPVQRFLDALTRPYRSPNPSTTVVGDTAAGAGAGAGVETYRQTMQDSTPDWVDPIAETFAALGGGVGGMGAKQTIAGGANMAKNRAQSMMQGAESYDPAVPLRDAMTGERYANTDLDATAQIVQALASDPRAAAANTRAAMQQLGDLPLSQTPTSGALSDDVGMVGLERQIRLRPSQDVKKTNQTVMTERDRGVREAALDRADSIVPEGATGRQFTDAAAEIEGRRKAAAVETAQRGVDKAQGEINAVERAMREQAAEIAAGAGQEGAASTRLSQETIKPTVRAMQAERGARYDAIDPDRTVMRDVRPLEEFAERIAASENEILGNPDSVPSIINSLLRNAKNRKMRGQLLAQGETEAAASIPVVDEVSFGAMQDTRMKLARAIDAANQSGDASLAKNLREFRAALGAEAEILAAEGGDAGARAQQALDYDTNEFSPALRRGSGSEAQKFRRDLNRDRVNETTTPDEKVAGRFLAPGAKSKAEDLARIIEKSADPEAGRQAAREYVVARMASAGVVDSAGKVRPQQLRRFLNQWGDALDAAVPGLRDEVKDQIAKAERGERISEQWHRELRVADNKLTQAEKSKGALAFLLDKSPENAVAEIFAPGGDPEKRVADVLRAIGPNTSARNGLKAALRDYLMSRKTTAGVEGTTSGRRPLSFAQLDKLFVDAEGVLSQVLSPREMQALRQSHRLLRALKNADQRVTSGSQTAENQTAKAFLETFEIGAKAWFGVLKGGGITRTLRLFLARLPSNDEAVMEIIEKMQLDPEFAIHLWTRNVKEAGSPAWNAKLNKYLAAATGVEAATNEDD
jgi:hypothetical protein